MRGGPVFAAALLAGAATLVTWITGAPGPTCLGAGLLGAAATMHHRHPRSAPAGVLAALGLIAFDTPIGEVPLFLAAWNAFGIGRYTGVAVRIIAAFTTVLVAELGVGDDAFVPNLFLVVAPLLIGWALGERDAVARDLAARGAELEAERDVFAALSVRYERARISAELHDIVAHAISVMVVQASAGQRLAAADPARTQAAFDAIRDAARHAESDLGRLVTLLTVETADASDPELALINDLVAGAARTGLDVTLSLEGDLGLLSADVSRSAYLVVREGLTNALRYASGAPVRVRVRSASDEVVVEVRNAPAPRSAPLAGHGSSNGLRGLRERLDHAGGRLEAAATVDGGWCLRASLPRHPAVEALVAQRSSLGTTSQAHPPG